MFYNVTIHADILTIPSETGR